MSVLKWTYEVDGTDFTRAGEASSSLKKKLRALGIPAEIIRKVSIALYEGEINMVIHADGGIITIEMSPDRIDMTLADHGKGIPDIEQAMQAGWSTAADEVRSLGFGAGMGLPNMKKNSDEMRIESTVGVGTTVYMTVYINGGAKKAGA